MKYKVVCYKDMKEDYLRSKNEYSLEGACAIASALSLNLLNPEEVSFKICECLVFYQGYYIVKEA